MSLTFSSITAAYSQDYTYDTSGSLTKDSNKQISQINYNFLNLPDTIIYTDGRKMIFTYTGSGQKLMEQTIAANGALLQKRNYSSQFLYSNDTLKEIQHEDGRAVPVLPGNSATLWEYQYHLKDHLGNVRSTLTSKQEVDNSTATFETATQVAEQNQFIRYEDARRINSYLFDHSDNGVSSYSERLSGSANEKYGLAKSLSVMPGDTIKLKVFAKYVDPNATDLKPVLTSLLSQIAASAAGVVVDGASYSTSTSSFPTTLLGLVNTSGSSGSGPKAFLNWLVFDRNYVFKDGGFKRMGTAGKENGSNVAHEELSAELVIKEPGYVYVYLSNEEGTPVEVYFDDFNVTQVKGPVIQQTDYDPFGLTFNEYSGENAAPNNFLYNGKELQKDFDLNWYDYGARMYDAALGRWHVIDPKAEKFAAWSPYNYVMNNPISYTDPDGRAVKEADPTWVWDDDTNSWIQSEVIEVTGKAPEDDLVDDNSALAAAMLKEAIAILERTKTGRYGISQLPLVYRTQKLHIRGKSISSYTSDHPDVRGSTALSGNIMSVGVQGIGVFMSGGKTIIKTSVGDELDVFNGFDMSPDLNAGKQSVLMAVAIGDDINKYMMAAVIGHEIICHVEDHLSNAAYGIDISDHDSCGGPYTPLFFVDRDPSNPGNFRVIVNSGATLGSTMDKLADELGAIYASDLNAKRK